MTHREPDRLAISGDKQSRHQSMWFTRGQRLMMRERKFQWISLRNMLQIEQFQGQTYWDSTQTLEKEKSYRFI